MGPAKKQGLLHPVKRKQPANSAEPALLAIELGQGTDVYLLQDTPQKSQFLQH